MAEVTGPIIAITLVLLSVFIPTAVMPGIAGKLYQQFALTISVAMVISAINALSLSPALCSLLLVRRGTPRGLMARYPARHRCHAQRLSPARGAADPAQRTGGRAGRPVRARDRRAAEGRAHRLPARGGPVLLQRPRSSCLDAASTSRTLEAVIQVEDMLKGQPWLQNSFTVSGNSLLDGLNLPNRAMMIVSLKPYGERPGHDMSVFAVLERLNKAFQRWPRPTSMPSTRRRSPGSATPRASSSRSRVSTGAPPEEIAAVARGVINAAQSAPELTGVFTTYSASTPQIRPWSSTATAPRPWGRHPRHLRRPADRDGQQERQQLQHVRPHLDGARAGRRHRPPHRRRRQPGARALVERHAGAVAGDGDAFELTTVPPPSTATITCAR